MGSAQLRRPDEQAKTETASSNPVHNFFTRTSPAIEVQFFIHGPRDRVEAFLRAYNDSSEIGHLYNILRDYRDILQRVKVDGQSYPTPQGAMDAVCRKLNISPLNYRLQ